MKLITRFELASRRPSELRALYRKLAAALPGTVRGSAARRNCLASLENIEREIASRSPRP